MKLPIDPQRINPRDIDQIVAKLRDGKIIAYPTDTVYGLGCDIFQKRAVESIYKLKGKDPRAPLSFACADLKDIAKYAVVSDQAYRILRRILPGPFTMVMRASKLVPKIMVSKQKTVGIRVPDHPVTKAIIDALGNPIVTSSVPVPDGHDVNDPNEIDARLGHALGMVIDSGLIYPEPSTIIDLTEMPPKLLRRGKGDIDALGYGDIIEVPEEDDIAELD